MKANRSRPGAVPPSQAAAKVPAFHRSGAVAGMLGMPVATLRVWERRYRLTQSALSTSGQRRYSAEDVRRLALIKRLNDLGHAIGSLAALDLPQLQQAAATHAQATAATRKVVRREAVDPLRPAWRLGVIGAALGARLRRPALLQRLGRHVVLVGPFDDAAGAAAALKGATVDALLIQQPHLHEGWLAGLDAAAPALTGVPKAVLYGFAADAVCESLATAGTVLLREPQPDAAVAQWLHALSMATAPLTTLAERVPPSPEPRPPRRWDDASLAAFADLSPTTACECPRHVAELLVQLSRFEAYSAECANRSAADAELHGYLGQVAAVSRAHFETALEHVALHEGLVLPPLQQP